MRVLVIGGSRFIGRLIVERLLGDGHRVTLLNRGVTPDPFGTRVSRVLGDRTDPASLEQAARRREHDAVVDVVAFRGEDTEAAVRCFSGRTGHFVHISSAAVYLIREGLLCPYREEDMAGRLKARSSGDPGDWLHAFGKARCEAVLAEAFARDGFPYTSLRLPMVVGPHDPTGRFGSYVERLQDGGPVILPDGGLNSWGFLWAPDVAETVASNLHNQGCLGRAYNLCQREVVSLRQLLEATARLLGARPRLVPVPGEWLHRCGLGTSFSPYSHDHDILLDTSAACRDLLFVPTPFATWCERLVATTLAEVRQPAAHPPRTRPAELRLVEQLSRMRIPVARAGQGPAFR